MLTARLHAVRRSDAGITLTELLVAMTLAGLVGAMTLLVFVSTNRAVSDTSDSLIASGDARVTLQTWQTLMQAADAPQTTNTCSSGATAHRFEWITDRDTLFYANLGNRSTDTSGSCAPQTMVWLALRNDALLEARYSVAAGQTTYQRTLCRTLSLKPQATVTAGSLFTPNPGRVLMAANFGATFASGTPFANAGSCAATPATVNANTVRNSDQAAVNALALVNVVGIDFVVRDSGGKHTQNYDATVAVLGGTT
jgi:type II secretory pathway pseudopilin PulG